MSDKDRRIFDASYRAAVTAYDDYDQSMRGIAKAFSSGDYPLDWGVQVRATMQSIRAAKVLLSKAINAAGRAASGPELSPDEVRDIQRSESYLNNRLQRLIAVEETLLNTLLIGDADYTALYIEAQRTHDAMEDRIARVAYGDSGRPDDSEYETFHVPTPPRVTMRPGEATPVIIDDARDIDLDGDSFDDDEPEIVPGDDEDYEEPEDEPDDDYEDAPEDEEHDVSEPVHIGGSPATPDESLDESDVPPEDDVSESSEPQAPETGPQNTDAPVLSEDEIVRQIMTNPAVQQLIHEEARRQAEAQLAAMMSEASSEVPRQEEHPTPQRIEVSTGEDIDASAIQPEQPKRILHRMRGKSQDKPAKRRSRKSKEGSA